jgi:hypothetical protein
VSATKVAARGAQRDEIPPRERSRKRISFCRFARFASDSRSAGVVARLLCKVFFHKLNGAFRVRSRYCWREFAGAAQVLAIAIDALARMSETLISSAFLQSREKSCGVRACIISFDASCVSNARADAQDVVSRKCEDARSCENALIFLLLV